MQALGVYLPATMRTCHSARLLTDTCPQQCEPAIVRAFCASSDKPRLKICILLSARVLPQSIAKSVAL